MTQVIKNEAEEIPDKTACYSESLYLDKAIGSGVKELQIKNILLYTEEAKHKMVLNCTLY